MVTNHEKPSFCKDLFEKKIVGELGLLRPSNNQNLKTQPPTDFEVDISLVYLVLVNWTSFSAIRVTKSLHVSQRNLRIK